MSAIASYNRFLARRLHSLLLFEREAFTDWLTALVLAAPLSLLLLDGAAFAAGVAYGVLYLLLGAIPGALSLLLIYDGVRLLFRRDAVVFPWFLAFAVAHKDMYEEEASEHIKRFHKLAINGNLLLPIAREVLFTAARFNPEAIERLYADVKARAREIKDNSSRTASPVLTVEARVWRAQVKRARNLSLVNEPRRVAARRAIAF